MTFCPQCGRSRAGEARFCGTCGHEFARRGAGTGPASAAASDAPGAADGPGAFDAPTVGGPSAPVRPEQIRWDTPVAPPRWDVPPGVAYQEVSHQETAVAGWEPPPAADVTAAPPGEPATEPTTEPAAEPAGQWEEWSGWENTVTTGPARTAGFAAGYASPPPVPPAAPAAAGPAFPPPQSPFPPQPPQSPQPPFPPPQPPWTGDQGQRPTRRGRWIFVLIAVLVVLGAGGGAYALTRAQRPSTPAASRSAGPVTTRTTAAATTPAAPTGSGTASPSASASPSPSPSPTRTGPVRVATAAASDPAEPGVLAYVVRYFNAINAHDYNAYYNLLDGQEQAGESQASFDSGYATTKDSNEVLTGIQDTGGGDVTVNLSFTSRQDPSDSIDGQACNTWQISLYLVPQGSGYVQTAPPPDYRSAHGDC